MRALVDGTEARGLDAKANWEIERLRNGGRNWWVWEMKEEDEGGWGGGSLEEGMWTALHHMEYLRLMALSPLQALKHTQSTYIRITCISQSSDGSPTVSGALLMTPMISWWDIRRTDKEGLRSKQHERKKERKEKGRIHFKTYVKESLSCMKVNFLCSYFYLYVKRKTTCQNVSFTCDTSLFHRSKIIVHK